MTSVNASRSHQDNIRNQLASAFGADVQRLLVFFSLNETSNPKHLIALAISIAERTSENITYNLYQALRAGASRDEIREAITVAVLSAGISLLSGVETLASGTQYEAQKTTSCNGPRLSGTRC
jgi:alkylhydroperoxidase/carboxymuconolactone decarboxylase family protein YurZ